jgi:hypothetical protein
MVPFLWLLKCWPRSADPSAVFAVRQSASRLIDYETCHAGAKCSKSGCANARLASGDQRAFQLLLFSAQSAVVSVSLLKLLAWSIDLRNITRGHLRMFLRLSLHLRSLHVSIRCWNHCSQKSKTKGTFCSGKKIKAKRNGDFAIRTCQLRSRRRPKRRERLGKVKVHESGITVHI